MPAASRAPIWLLSAAAIWSAGLIVAGLVAPMYSSMSSTSVTGSTGTFQARASTSATLVQVNGMRVLVPLCAPLVVVALVGFALCLPRRRSNSWPGVVAWVLAVALDGFAFVGMMTIGILVLPVGILVTVSCALP